MPNTKSANMFMLFMLAFQFLSVFVIELFFNLFGNIIGIGEFLVLNQVVCFLIPFAIYCVYTKVSGHPIKGILKLKKLNLKNIVLIIGMGIFIQPAMMLISTISALFFNNHVADILIQLSGYSLFYYIFIMAVVPSICEEIVFRGVIYKNYENADIKKALIINGLFFGLMHTSFQQFFYAFILGVLLAALVYYTGSIFASVLMHFVINASQVLLLHIIMMMESLYDMTEVSQAIQMSLYDYIPLILLIIVSTIVFVKFLRLFIKHNSGSEDSVEYTGEHSVHRPSLYIVCILYIVVTLLSM